MQKVIYCMMVVVLLAGMVLTACAPKSAPAPTAQPAPKEHAPANIEILGTRPDMHGYQLSYGLADIINKNSTWLRATTLETPGMSGSMGMLVTEQNRRANTLVCITADPWQEAVEMGKWGPYDGLRFVADMGPLGVALITLDRDIKKPQDLVGKKVGIHRKGTNMAERERQLFEVWGIADQVTFFNAGFGGQAKALGDGLIASSFQNTACVGAGEHRPGAAQEGLLAGKHVYYLDVDKETVLEAHKRFGNPYAPLRIPGGMMEGMGAPFGTIANEGLWACDVTMDEDIVYEICKIMAENTSEFGQYHVAGRAMTRDRLGLMLWHSPEKYHPGAAKYYRGHNIPMAEVEWNR